MSQQEHPEYSCCNGLCTQSVMSSELFLWPQYKLSFSLWNVLILEACQMHVHAFIKPLLLTRN